MLQPIASLPLSDATTDNLRENGLCFVEDIQITSESTASGFTAIQEARKFCTVPTTCSALDILKEELQQYKISTLSRELNKVLDGGFKCGTITELCGAPGSGRTQICLQLCVTVQFSRKHNGLKGEVLYIDTRSGVSISRLEEMAMNCQAHFEDQDFDIIELLNRVIISSPQTYDDIFTVLNNFAHITRNRQVRLIIVNSLSFLRYSIEKPLERTQICFKLLDELHKLAMKHNLAVSTNMMNQISRADVKSYAKVIITNELVTQITEQGEVDLQPAGGHFCAHRIHARLMLTRLDNNEFAACAIKSSTLPKVSSKFQVTVCGIRDTGDRI